MGDMVEAEGTQTIKLPDGGSEVIPMKFGIDPDDKGNFYNDHEDIVADNYAKNHPVPTKIENTSVAVEVPVVLTDENNTQEIKVGEVEINENNTVDDNEVEAKFTSADETYNGRD